jgi:hypothetical protein
MFLLHGPGRDRLAAVSIGTGRVAVVLAHQSSGSLCQWWPYARTLAARFRVVAFDFGVDLVNAEYGFAQVREAVLRFIRAVTHG